MIKQLFLALAMCFSALGVYAADPVDINKAGAEVISSQLSGIGPSKADAIVKYRSENGPFHSVEELMNVSGIGEKTLAAIRDNIVVVVPLDEDN